MPHPDSFLLGAVQMTSTADRARNLAPAVRLVEEAADLGARLVGLPENFGFMGRDDWKGCGDEYRLPSQGGLFWPIPITLSAEPSLADSIGTGEEVALWDTETDPASLRSLLHSFVAGDRLHLVDVRPLPTEVRSLIIEIPPTIHLLAEHAEDLVHHGRTLPLIVGVDLAGEVGSASPRTSFSSGWSPASADGVCPGPVNRVPLLTLPW